MKVVFYGGRQALRAALAYVREAPDAQDASWMSDHLPPSPKDLATLRGAEKILCVESGAPGLDAGALEIPGEILRLPELQLDFLWPFGGQPHIDNAADAHYSDGPFPAELGDAWLNRALEGRSGLEAVEAEYLALDVARVVDLDRMREMSFARMAERDARYGVEFARPLAAAFRAGPLFLSPRVPSASAFSLVMQAAFARLGLDAPQKPEPEPTLRELPIHPSVAGHFGLGWARGRGLLERACRFPRIRAPLPRLRRRAGA